ncbi:hypothetical protein LINPERHAP1_LOCUS39006 [Linum perenne]
MNDEGIKDVEEDTSTKESTDNGKRTSSAGSKRSHQQMTEDYLSSINDQMGTFEENIVRTSANIECLIDNWCMPIYVASRRAYLVDETSDCLVLVTVRVC